MAAAKKDQDTNGSGRTGGTSVGGNGAPPTDGQGPGPGHNVPVSAKDNPEVHAVIRQACAEMEECDDQAAEINAKKRAIREGLVNRGIPRESFALAYRAHKLSDEKRAGIDEGLVICRKALSMPIQPALFEAAHGEPQAPAGAPTH